MAPVESIYLNLVYYLCVYIFGSYSFIWIFLYVSQNDIHLSLVERLKDFPSSAN